MRDCEFFRFQCFAAIVQHINAHPNQADAALDSRPCTARHPCAWGSVLSASGVIFLRYSEHTNSAVSSGTRPERAPILVCECLHLLSASAAVVITDHWASRLATIPKSGHTTHRHSRPA